MLKYHCGEHETVLFLKKEMRDEIRANRKVTIGGRRISIK